MTARVAEWLSATQLVTGFARHPLAAELHDGGGCILDVATHSCEAAKYIASPVSTHAQSAAGDTRAGEGGWGSTGRWERAAATAIYEARNGWIAKAAAVP